MKRNTTLTYLVYLLAFAAGPVGAQTPASTPAPSFTISASNITMPTSGTGSIPIMVTAVDGYTGTILLECTTATPPAEVLQPYCNPPHFGPALSLVLTASESTVKGSIPITSLEAPTSSSGLNLLGRGTTGLALAGMLMLGLGRRRRRRWPILLAMTTVTLIGLTGISACGGGSPKTLTPGTYTYTIQATSEGTPQANASTTVNVAVPPGVIVQKPGS